MRARRAGSKAALDLPAWVTVQAPASPDLQPTAHCARCGKEERLLGGKPDAERALGRFGVWHRRCTDPDLIASAVKQAGIDREAARARDEWFARRRR